MTAVCEHRRWSEWAFARVKERRSCLDCGKIETRRTGPRAPRLAPPPRRPSRCRHRFGPWTQLGVLDKRRGRTCTTCGHLEIFRPDPPPELVGSYRRRLVLDPTATCGYCEASLAMRTMAWYSVRHDLWIGACCIEQPEILAHDHPA